MSEWTWEWPKKAGYYWFHGHKWGTQLCDERLPSTHLVLCRIDATGSPFYVTDGHFLYKAEGGTRDVDAGRSARATRRPGRDLMHTIPWTPPAIVRALWWWVRGVDVPGYLALCKRCGRRGMAHWSLWGCWRFK